MHDEKKDAKLLLLLFSKKTTTTKRKTNNLQVVVNIEHFDGAYVSVVFLCHLVHQVMTQITIEKNYLLVCFLLNKDRKKLLLT